MKRGNKSEFLLHLFWFAFNVTPFLVQPERFLSELLAAIHIPLKKSDIQYNWRLCIITPKPAGFSCPLVFIYSTNGGSMHYKLQKPRFNSNNRFEGTLTALDLIFNDQNQIIIKH